MPYTRRVSRPHRLATVALLAVLLWTPAQGAVCLGWCDVALPDSTVAHEGHASAIHEGHDAADVAVAVAPCHGADAAAATALSAVALAACDDAPGTFENGVLPASPRADAVMAPAAFVFVPARSTHVSGRAASDADPPGSVSSRAPLVLRI